MRACLAILALASCLATAPVWAVQPDEILDDPALEARARDLSQELRCLVCQNQSIDDSNAPLARDLRVLVRERLVAGDGDAAVLRFVTERYGDYVLLRPPVKPSTYGLWFGPALILLIAGFGVVLYLRQRPERRDEAMALSMPLSAEELARLDAVMKGLDGDKGGKATS